MDEWKIEFTHLFLQLYSNRVNIPYYLIYACYIYLIADKNKLGPNPHKSTKEKMNNIEPVCNNAQ